MHDRYIDIIAEVANFDVTKEDITEDMSLVDDLGFDSLAFINMVVAIENDYGITFNDEYINMEKLKTVKDVKNYLVQSQS
ncbi:MAG: acyl carrier protein [Clostridia bacterium]|nr:acyl carrier protein [Clostridia bacterium]